MLNSSGLSSPASVDTSETSSQDAELVRVLEECLVDIESGRSVDTARLRAQHPEIAERLETCLAALSLVHATGAAHPRGSDSGAAAEASAALGRLGDFDLVREIGRGGMGVVYEARQVSLGRRVALKVLPFAATLDPRQLQRFLTEAQAAAVLHHPHIVPVYSVGCERGVHYYAMQFIEGQSLAGVIAGVQAQRPESTRVDTSAAAGVPRQLPRTTANPTLVALTTEREGPAQYYRTVARLGVQAALALEHAHQLGVIHRDIKPANLLVDIAGNLWITDFGLARLRTHIGPTLSGDTVGTLRYMSPEQALARRGLLDHRTDIYSLGSTLYEALTLRPAYPGDERDEVLRHIAEGTPVRPRRVVPSIPFELETIVLKGMAREPETRYSTAQELADDLNRFLEHRPVRATRPTLRDRLGKWAWRHKAVLGAIAVVTVPATLGLLAMTFLLWREQRQTNIALAMAETREAEARANRERAEANFKKALTGLNQLLWELENPRWNKDAQFADVRRELTRKGLQIFQDFIDTSSNDPAVRFQAARAYEKVVIVLLVDRQWAKAAEAYAKAVALFRRLQEDEPANTEYGIVLGRLCTTMGKWDTSLQHPDQAKTEYREAIAAYERALPNDREGWVHNNLAFLLCDCQQSELRDARRARILARQAVMIGPAEAEFHRTLGLAEYRSGDYATARRNLEKSMHLASGGDARDWLLLTLVAVGQGREDEARTWYARAAEWLKTNPMSDTLYHFRKEAADLLNITWPMPRKEPS